MRQGRFGFLGITSPPLRHEKTSAGIAPIGGRAFKHTFHNTITMRTFVLRLEKAQKSPIALFD